MLSDIEGAVFVIALLVCVVAALAAAVYMVRVALPLKPFDHRKAGFRLGALLAITFVSLLVMMLTEGWPSSLPVFIVAALGGTVYIAATGYILMWSFSRGFTKMQAAREEQARERSLNCNTDRRSTEK